MSNTESAPWQRALKRATYYLSSQLQGLGVYTPPRPTNTVNSTSNLNTAPIVTGAGRAGFLMQGKEKFTLLAQGKKNSNLVYINKKITIKNPYTGKTQTYNGYFVPKGSWMDPSAKAKGSGSGSGSSSSSKNGAKGVPQANPADWTWNLPPHAWSMPLSPNTVVAESGTYRESDKDEPKSRGEVDHLYRRGRIWWKATPDIQIRDSDGKLKKTSNSGNKYGFQFIWNPETFGTQVSVNMDITPTANDRFIGVAGAFPATETITFNVRLDRTNDFAAMAAAMPRPSSTKRGFEKADPNYSYLSGLNLSQFTEYYKKGGVWQNDQKLLESKIRDLIERGTISDLEYLYRAINGKGPGDKSWINGRGIPTADIGFLMPTLLHIDIGPLSYDGFVSALQVNHLAFTQDMVPIRTDVTISCNLLATAGLAAREATE